MRNLLCTFIAAGVLAGCPSIPEEATTGPTEPSSVAFESDLVNVKSHHGAKETMDRLQALAEQRGLKVFARIDHAAGAASIGETMRPTEVLVFGNPKGGTPMMECAQTIGIDLPLKVLVWEDVSSQVWVGYYDPVFIARRHAPEPCPAAMQVREVLAGVVQAAAAP